MGGVQDCDEMFLFGQVLRKDRDNLLPLVFSSGIVGQLYCFCFP